MARNVANLAEFVGTYLPGYFFLVVGALLRREGEAASGGTYSGARFKNNSELGIVGGIVIMLTGSGLSQRQDPTWFFSGAVMGLVGWAVLILGCVNFMRWKGYSGWWGLFGYLLLPGIVILACFPNRRKALLQLHGLQPADAKEAYSGPVSSWPADWRSDETPRAAHGPQLESLKRRDQTSGLRYWLALLPLALLAATAGSAIGLKSSHRVSEWTAVGSPGDGFTALMPGKPRLEQQTIQGPEGDAVIQKFIATPNRYNELFMIVAVRYSADRGQQFGGLEKLLELGRQDLLNASKGSLSYETPVEMDGWPGLDLEILPPQRGIVRARVYATDDSLFEVFVQVSKLRRDAHDVQKFLDSFHLKPRPDALGPDGERGQ
jgi:hypothetical protein